MELLNQPLASLQVPIVHDLIELWHTYRTSLILCALFLLLAARLYFHARDERQNLIVLPQIFEKDAPQPSPPPAPKSTVKPKAPRRIRGGIPGKASRQKDHKDTASDDRRPIKVIVFFSSVTMRTEQIANEYIKRLAQATEELARVTAGQFLQPELHDLTEIDFDDFFLAPPTTAAADSVSFFYLFLIPSYNIDTINDTLLEHMRETHHDFRVNTAPLAPLLGYSVFGFGDKDGWRDESEGYCFQAKELDKWMSKLTGRKRAYPIGMGDVKSDHETRLAEWTLGILDLLHHLALTPNLGDGVPGSGDAVESDDDDDDNEQGADEAEDEQNSGNAPPPPARTSGNIDDVEDIGRKMGEFQSHQSMEKQKPTLAVDFTSTNSTREWEPPAAAKEMVAVNSPTYLALTKQGYSIVGSHSGVKICRWTKSALRGRGSCYKYSLYGINSHQCMETTPSLSCSNKCVFCWRHGTNPVGTTWRWVVDPPEMIFEGVKENHYKKIKMMRGVPGVRAERYAEALRIRHCALSLVGEPIFYPYINEFLALLHAERISSFLVCNAQHPDQLAALKAVTQLYVSIDASNRDSLRKIDRPLHRDFWERFQACLDILREKRFRHRTVYRLTLVKGFNVEDEAEGYAQLVERGLPCFIEVKGVTYCGTSTSSNAGLTMSNVPFYWEVCDFVRALEKRLRERHLPYGIAAEHAHSCCILIASERFKVEGRWHTHIDYDKFFQLLEERGPDGDWRPEDYMGQPTPDWALWGSGGFDPRDERVDRKGRKIENTVMREAPIGEVF